LHVCNQENGHILCHERDTVRSIEDIRGINTDDVPIVTEGQVLDDGNCAYDLTVRGSWVVNAIVASVLSVFVDGAIFGSDHCLLGVRRQDHLDLLHRAADLQLRRVHIVGVERFGDVESVMGNVVKSLRLG
jgi:hypothetical protein